MIEKEHLIFFALTLIGVGTSVVMEAPAVAPIGGMLATAYLAIKGKKPFVCAEKK